MYSGGSGTIGDPYLIANVTDLKNIESNMSSYFKQINDITLGNFEPIGYNSGNDTPIDFTGNYDGNNYTIKDGIINYPALNRVGIFRSIGATIKNIKLSNIIINGYMRTGIISGSAISNSNIFNIHTDNNCKIYATAIYCGGIIGYLDSNSVIENCSNAANIISYNTVGGIIGYLNAATVKNCYNMGHIINTGNYTGGIVGRTSDEVCLITKCLNRGILCCGNFSGGIVGRLSINSNAICSDNVAVQQRINKVDDVSYASVGRITGTKLGTLTNNYARSDMLGYNTFSAIAADDIDGASIIYTSTLQKITYLNIGWNFIDTGGYWNIIENTTYATLQNAFPYQSLYSGGSGTKFDPYLISDAKNLKNIEWNKPSYFKQINDITLDDFEPIGLYSSGIAFTGSYDGCNYTIKNGTIHYLNNNKVGLFASSEGTHKNIKFKNISIKGKQYVGMLVGFSGNDSNTFSIENVHINNDCNIMGTSSDTGGIVGYYNGYDVNRITINACSNKATVIGYQSVGGIVGTGYDGKITNCYNEGQVTGLTIYVGGILGYSTSCNIKYCYNTGNIMGTDYCGGIGGSITNQYIENCYALNNFIIRTSGWLNHFGRVSGVASTNLKNNYASEQMYFKIL